MSGVLNLLLAGAASAIRDAYFNLTTLLLNTSSTNGAQNNTFLDSSTNNFTITRNGNTTQGTFTPFSQTGWSNFLNTGYLTAASNAAFDFGSGDATIEAWIYPTSSGQTCGIFDKRSSGGNYSQFPQIALNSGALVVLVSYSGSSWAVTINGATPAVNAWTHIALVRNGNTWTLYVNGAVSGTPVTASGSVYASTDSLSICAATSGGLNPFAGYISNVRLVKGTAVYTSAFTPSTTPLTAITNTSLLTCQSNRFLDNSTNAFTVTPNGTYSVQAFSPFAPTAAYDTAVVGGSGYFDGTGDYLTGPSASGGDFGSGNFTISFWYYPVSNANYGLLSYADTGGWNGWQIQQTGSNTIKFEFLSGSTGDSAITGGTVYANQWNYVVITRSGSTVTLYTNSTSSAGTSTNSSSYGVSGSRIIVGNERSVSPGTPLNGYLSNVKLVKQANAPASIPTAPDTNTTNTSFLLNFTNSGIYDSTAKNVLETVGNAQVSTTQAKWGTTSISILSAGAYCKSPSSSNWGFGTGDYTVEFWMYKTTSTSYGSIISVGTGAGGLGIAISSDSSVVVTRPGTAIDFTFSAGLTLNTWYHVAICRSGTSLRCFVNGTQVGTTQTSSANYATSYLNVGIDGDSSSQQYIGYIDDLRITKYARYTANFTAPTAAFGTQ